MRGGLACAKSYGTTVVRLNFCNHSIFAAVYSHGSRRLWEQLALELCDETAAMFGGLHLCKSMSQIVQCPCGAVVWKPDHLADNMAPILVASQVHCGPWILEQLSGQELLRIFLAVRKGLLDHETRSFVLGIAVGTLAKGYCDLMSVCRKTVLEKAAQDVVAIVVTGELIGIGNQCAYELCGQGLCSSMLHKPTKHSATFLMSGNIANHVLQFVDHKADAGYRENLYDLLQDVVCVLGLYGRPNISFEFISHLELVCCVRQIKGKLNHAASC